MRVILSASKHINDFDNHLIYENHEWGTKLMLPTPLVNMAQLAEISPRGLGMFVTHRRHEVNVRIDAFPYDDRVWLNKTLAFPFSFPMSSIP